MSLRSALHWLTTCASHHLPTGRKEFKILQKFGVCPKISVQDKKIEKLIFQRDSVISFFPMELPLLIMTRKLVLIFHPKIVLPLIENRNWVKSRLEFLLRPDRVLKKRESCAANFLGDTYLINKYQLQLDWRLTHSHEYRCK